MDFIADICKVYESNKDFNEFSENIRAHVDRLVDYLSDECFNNRPNEKSDYVDFMFAKCQQPMGRYVNSLEYLRFKNEMDLIYEEIKQEFEGYVRYMQDQRMLEND